MYSCVDCGSPFPAYPPDDRHKTAARNENDYEDHIKVIYRCRACGKDNTIYGGHAKPPVAIF